jgi:hypothetical protein
VHSESYGVLKSHVAFEPLSAMGILMGCTSVKRLYMCHCVAHTTPNLRVLASGRVFGDEKSKWHIKMPAPAHWVAVRICVSAQSQSIKWRRMHFLFFSANQSSFVATLFIIKRKER